MKNATASDVSNAVGVGRCHSRGPREASEVEADRAARRMLEFVRKAGGQYIRRDTGLGIASPAGIVSLSLRSDNIPLDGLLLQACGITITTQLGKAVVVRLTVAESVAATFQYRSLGAASLTTIHLPTIAGRLLEIKAEGKKIVAPR